MLRAEVFEAEAGTLGVRVRVGATPKWRAQQQQQRVHEEEEEGGFDGLGDLFG